MQRKDKYRRLLKGIGSVLNIGSRKKYHCSDAKEADIKALQSDWKIIGDDMQKALNEYKRQNKK